jgi:hypothetical protein
VDIHAVDGVLFIALGCLQGLACASALGGGQVTEYQLRQFFFLSLLPDAVNVADTQVNLAAGVIRQ